jgi:hypothetical protein
MILKRIFGPKRDQVKRKWRKLHSEELHNLYSSTNILKQIQSRRMRWARHEAHTMERRVCMVLVGKSEGKRPH